MNRRRFMVALGVGALCALGVERYLNNETMRKAPVREGKIIADLHAHPANYKSNEKTLEMLCSHGLVGLSYWLGAKTILNYELVCGRFSNLVSEIDRGMLASIRSPGGDSYFARSQEIECGAHHVLAVGFEGDYLPNFNDARKAVEAIHRRNGIAILNHPYITPQNKFARYRFINSGEEEKVRELCQMVDEVEIFNAQCINPTLGIMVPNMKKANALAEKLALQYGHKGTVSTDAHYRMEQPKICGIYVEKEGFCIDKLKHDIASKRFDNDYRRYVSRYSFAAGMFFR
ncbi:MAG: hypothetical protein V1906_00830 [Candidatus Woesearchaeota archaeon]